jgi:hypothetical protein
VIAPSDLKAGTQPFTRLPWRVQMFVVFYLRAAGYACTEEQRELAASILEQRIALGPLDHHALAVVLDRQFPRERQDGFPY